MTQLSIRSILIFSQTKLDYENREGVAVIIQELTTEGTFPGASIAELAVDYKVSESLLYSMANRGELPGCRRLGKRFVIHRETFEEWLRAGMGDQSMEDLS